ncbi:zinc finger protein 341 [Platysternon megacephalum]|uniref:LIM domain only protein 3 n=1 Tax=Platysternon megacephalum TaxID=55544 RepID=A0A4D9EEX4_9SAUR|nr:zinc finger protein 341 [Platysternon megacephalum]
MSTGCVEVSYSYIGEIVHRGGWSIPVVLKLAFCRMRDRASRTKQKEEGGESLEPTMEKPGRRKASVETRAGRMVTGIQMLSVQPDTKPKGCAGCNRKIKDRYLLKALDKYWHEDCLKCACCDCRLGEVGSTLYTKANLILCRRDYLRLFGVTGNCAACSKLIPAFEMVMRAKENVYHLDCFACQLCNQRFCVGDKFFLKNNMILCQTDYEEGLMKEGYAPQVR